MSELSEKIKAICQKIEDGECIYDNCSYTDNRCMDCDAEAILAAVIEMVEGIESRFVGHEWEPHTLEWYGADWMKQAVISKLKKGQ